MAPRQTARRLLVAAPALALALAVTACSPPNEQPADPDAPYTLPTYSEEAEPTTSSTAPEAAEGENAEGAEGAAGVEGEGAAAEGAAGAEGTAAEGAEAGVDADGTATGDAQTVPGQGQQAGLGMNAPAAPPVQPAP